MRTAGSPVLALGRSPVSRVGVGTAEEAGAGEADVITRGDGDRESSSTEKLCVDNCGSEIRRAAEVIVSDGPPERGKSQG